MNRTSNTTLPGRPHDYAPPPAGGTPERWWESAACRFFGPGPFFAPDHETHGQRARREHAAKLICRPCPVRGACLQHALTTRESYGIWGGTSESERNSR